MISPHTLRILCTIALASIAFHYATRKLPHMLEGKVTNYLRIGEASQLEFPRQSRRLVDTGEVDTEEESEPSVSDYLRRTLEQAIQLEPPRQSRRLVDTTEVEPCSCTCELDGGDEGYSVISMDSALIDSLGGEPTICIPKNQLTALVSSGNGVCDDLCVTKFKNIVPGPFKGTVPTGAPTGAPTWSIDENDDSMPSDDDDDWFPDDDDDDDDLYDSEGRLIKKYDDNDDEQQT